MRQTLRFEPTGAAAPLACFDRCDGTLCVAALLGEDAETRRLCELGVCIGRSLAVVCRGNPAIIELEGARFAMTRELQARVLVRPVA